MWALKKKESRGANLSTSSPRDRLLDVGEAVLEREGELLLCGRARLADVVAGDRDRVPARHVLGRPLDHVPDQPHRRLDRSTTFLGDVLLEDVGLDRAAEALRRDPCSSATQTQAPDRRRALIVIDVVTLSSSIPANSVSMSSRVSIATPSTPTSPRLRSASESSPIRVGMSKAVLRPVWPYEEVVEALVGLLRGPEPGELAHRPEPPPVHRGRRRACRVLARIAEVALGVGPSRSSSVYSGLIS